MKICKRALLRTAMQQDSFWLLMLIGLVSSCGLVFGANYGVCIYGSSFATTTKGRLIAAPVEMIAKALPSEWQETWKANARVGWENLNSSRKSSKDREPYPNPWFGWAIDVFNLTTLVFGLLIMPFTVRRIAAHWLQREVQRLYERARIRNR